MPIIPVRTVLVKCLKIHKYEAVKYKMCSEKAVSFCCPVRVERNLK